MSSDSNAKGKSLLGILLSILVLSLISSVIVAAIFIVNPEIATLERRPFVAREAITLEESMLGELSPSQFVSQWLLGSESTRDSLDELLFEDSKNINLLSLPTADRLRSSCERSCNSSSNLHPTPFTTLVANTSLLASLDYQGFRLSPSKRYLLIYMARRRQFRHSSTAKYLIYDTKLDLISLLSTRPFQSNEPVQANSYQTIDSAAPLFTTLNSYLSYQYNEYTQFQLVRWFSMGSDEDSEKQDSLIMIQDNDIYILSNLSATDPLQTRSRSFDFLPKRLTYSGRAGEIFNAVPDWLYEEEILGDRAAFEFSPRGTRLAFMTFNDSLVEEMPFSIFGDLLIPKIRRIRYPKAGRVNPTVQIQVVEDLRSFSQQQHNSLTTLKSLRMPDSLNARQHYITQIKWLTNDKLALVWLNRLQNESFIMICSRELDWSCQENLHMISQGGWLEMTDELYPYKGDSYITLMYKNSSDPSVGAFKQVVRVSMVGSNNFTFLTDRQSEVTNINGLDERLGIVYYTATPENQPGQRQIYSSHIHRTGAQKVSNCLTCDHHPDECSYNNIKMSSSTSHYIFECDGPSVPRIELRRNIQAYGAPLDLIEANRSSTSIVERNSSIESLLWVVERNQQLREKISHLKAMPLTLRLTVPLADSNMSANVMLLLPPQLGYRTVFKGPPNSTPTRSQRGTVGTIEGIERPLHVHFTPETIGEYMRQIPSGHQFPMVVEVYAGPGTQHVDFRYKINFGHYLASSRRTIYAIIDGRGSGFQGTSRMYEVYHRLGSIEVQDQIEVVSQLTRNFSFIDPDRVAIWGWSYGGYAAAMALAQSNARSANLNMNGSTYPASGNHTKVGQKRLSNLLLGQLGYNPRLKLVDDGVFECAASVAPVTNWLLYDTAYTERYMSSPYLNERFDDRSGGDHALHSSLAGKALASSEEARVGMLIVKERTNEWLASNQTNIRAISMDPPSSSSSRVVTLDLPDLNSRYKAASLLEQVANIDKKRFLLIHGTADDNVHFQQSIMLMRKLIQQNVMFESRLYPDQDHSIGNRPDKLHLGSTLSNFFAECFDMAF